MNNKSHITQSDGYYLDKWKTHSYEKVIFIAGEVFISYVLSMHRGIAQHM